MHRHGRPSRRALATLLAAATLSMVTALGSSAPTTAAQGGPIGPQGVPLMVWLGYVEGVSTWGPTGATGFAEVSIRLGEVRLHASGLPVLPDEHYRVWIVDTSGGERVALGGFKADEAGTARLDLAFRDPLPERRWDLVLVSVEADGGQPSEPSARRSMAGYVPAYGVTPAIQEAEAAEAPSPAIDGGSALLLGLTLAAGLGITLARLRRTRRRPRGPRMTAERSG